MTRTQCYFLNVETVLTLSLVFLAAILCKRLTNDSASLTVHHCINTE